LLGEGDLIPKATAFIIFIAHLMKDAMKIWKIALIATLVFPFNTYAQEKPAETAAVSQQPPIEKNTKYTRPLFFAVDESQIQIQNPLIEYDLESSQGAALQMGNLKFTNESLKVQIENSILKVTWDKLLVHDGEFSVIDAYGKELWKIKITDTAVNPGQWVFPEWKSPKGPQWKSGSHLRFCLKAKANRGFSALCTQNYGIEMTAGSVRLDYVKESGIPRVIVLNEETKKLKGQAEVAPGAPAQFLATLKTGATFEFLSEVQALELKDIVESEKKDFVSLKGKMPAPLQSDVKILPGMEYGKVTKALGFQKSIAEPADLWQADVPAKNAKLLVPGSAGGVFSYNLIIKSYPKIKDRLYVSDDVWDGTYKAQDKVLVRVPEQSEIEGLVALKSKSPESANLREWSFAADKKFEMNSAKLIVKDGQESHQAYLDIYRGSAGEASLRLSGIASSAGGTSILGEGHLSYWFNDLWTWQNYWLSKQRWGVSAKYFTGLTALPAEAEDGTTSDVDLSSLQVDLRYRFNPGLWERDETVGAILGYENLTIGDDQIPKLGAGLFWARSMPKAFDRLLNKISFLNYPKFVDMEFVKYFSSLDSDIDLGADFFVNFHGKVLWTSRFFGEAGFGVKSYAFTKADNSGAELAAFYATLGVGYNF
jgi:hypothetical protein